MGGKLRDEILELLWSLREKGSKSIDDVIKGIGQSETSDVIRAMEKSGYVAVSGEHIEFTEKGESRARDVTRRHRLAERLFHDVLEVLNGTYDNAWKIAQERLPGVSQLIDGEVTSVEVRRLLKHCISESLLEIAQ